jgi:hypothetical protein
MAFIFSPAFMLKATCAARVNSGVRFLSFIGAMVLIYSRIEIEEHLMVAAFDEERLKELLKSALVEALEEHRDLVQDIVEEAIEDFALARAVEQGLKSKSVSRDEVFAILEGAQ